MMIGKIRKFLLPPGPVLSLTLLGLLLLSAVLYYRAVKIQRFLEPVLAITQPRIAFSESLGSIFRKEFGAERIRGIRLGVNSIFVEEPLLFGIGDIPGGDGASTIERLGKVFLSILEDPKMRANVDLILVSTSLPLSGDPAANKRNRSLFQERAAMVLNALYRTEPGIETKYGAFFASAAVPASPAERKANRIEFRIIPTEQIHIEVLRRLQKYAE